VVENALIWVGSNTGAVLCMAVAALAIGVVIYCARDFPPGSEKDDDGPDQYGC
jgi:hypothetical protein